MGSDSEPQAADVPKVKKRIRIKTHPLFFYHKIASINNLLLLFIASAETPKPVHIDHPTVAQHTRYWEHEVEKSNRTCEK